MSRIAMRLVATGLALATIAPVPESALAQSRRNYPVDTEEKLRKKLHHYFEFWGERGLDRRDRQAIYRHLSEVRRDVGRDLDTFPDQKFQVIITDSETFRSYSGASAHVGGMFDGKIHIPVPSQSDPKRLKAVLWHEYTHAVIHARTRGRCPTWLNEGFAEFQEAKIDSSSRGRARALLDDEGDLPFTLEQLEGSFWTGTPERTRMAYAQAFATVDYLFKRYRKRRVSEFLDAIAEGSDLRSALRKVFHTNPERLMSAVAKHLRRM